MKKAFFLSVFILNSLLASSQDTVKAAPTVDPKVLKAAATTDHAGEWMVVKKGKVYGISSGKMKLIDKEVALDNGSVLKPNGDVVAKDGSKIRITEDQRINRLGDLAKIPDSAQEKATKIPVSPPAPVTK